MFPTQARRQLHTQLQWPGGNAEAESVANGVTGAAPAAFAGIFNIWPTM